MIIAVYDRPDKQLLFATRQRLKMVRQAIAGLSNIEAESYTGLTVDFAKKIGAKVIVRGLRMGADFEREFDMALMNKRLSPEIDVICLMADFRYQFLSSSLLKEVASLNGNIDDLVPAHVAEALRTKLLAKP